MKIVGVLMLGIAIAMAARGEGKPNILHIHADDLRADGLHALGNADLQTPNLDLIVDQGFVFTQAYTMGSMTGAVCLPSRTMMLTGRSWKRIPGENAALPGAGDPETFLPRVMAHAGYQTWHMGKGGNAFTPGIQAFETNLIEDGKGAERAKSSKRLADETIAFFEKRASANEAKPFYVYLAPPVPHDPRIAEERFHQLYDPAKIKLPAAFLPVHPWDNGHMTVRDEKLAPWPRTPEDTRQQLAQYYACITGLDFHIGRVIETLKKSRQWDNTIVIVTGDNGLSMGEHGLFGKQNLYEFGGMHVPLVIMGPGIRKGRSDAMVYLMDLYPTIAGYGEAALPVGVEGKDLRPVIQGKASKVREVLYTGYRNCMRAVRDDRWKLIRYPLVDRTQLFDLQTDPHELINLAERPEMAGKLKELTSLLASQMSEYADSCPLKVDDPMPAEWIPPTTPAK